jgi:hypothetical protein
MVTTASVAIFSGQIKLHSKYLKDLDYINSIRNFFFFLNARQSVVGQSTVALKHAHFVFVSLSFHLLLIFNF